MDAGRSRTAPRVAQRSYVVRCPLFSTAARVLFAERFVFRSRDAAQEYVGVGKIVPADRDQQGMQTYVSSAGMPARRSEHIWTPAQRQQRREHDVEQFFPTATQAVTLIMDASSVSSNALRSNACSCMRKVIPIGMLAVLGYYRTLGCPFNRSCRILSA